MRTGKLRDRVILRRPVKAKDGKGGWSTSFEEVAVDLPACIETLDGREAVMEHVLEGVSSCRIWIRWRGDVAANWQVRLGGVDLNISAPPANPDRRRRWLMLTATTAAVLKTG
ncbi:phage head closure protein [Sphingomonas koreensis]|uniref:Head-tail adaptor protein n=1 Tax=Sphingomonas koreensis TaxID=93064 RepID=A0A1L6JCZ4_9SPHN|nr:phage head closure protein [Sphingomonas koreensis]APR53360.1 hypothetical protein BRX40_13815 [Sphingomonas koreensis]